MRCRSWKLLVFLPVIVLSVSCARLPDTAGAVQEPGMIPVQMLEDQQSVPTEWGKLVAVTNNPAGPSTRLWYQSEDGTIRMVSFHNPTALLKLRVRVIQRR